MPPASLNHRDPTTGDTPASRPASSLARPAAIAAQNRIRPARRATPGRPGERSGARSLRSERRLLVAIASSTSRVLRRPVETAQYLAIRYTERLAEAGIEPSVGSVGDSFDNALAETVIGLFKTEVIRRRGPWRNLETVEFATLEWVHWFNHRRLLGPIGHIPPAEAEARFHGQLENTAMVA